MAQDERERSTSKRRERNPNATQFDVALFVAARDKKDVELYFSLEALSEQRPDMVVMVEVVDKFMLKVDGVWIQKHHLAAVRVTA